MPGQEETTRSSDVMMSLLLSCDSIIVAIPLAYTRCAPVVEDHVLHH